MIINISLNTRSVGNSIKVLQNYKKKFPIMIDEFCQRSLTWISERANYYLTLRSHGFNTSDIRNSWLQIKKDEGFYILKNIDDVSAYAEFGTGLIGSENEHPKADETKYEYDVNGHGSNGWTFYNREQNLYLRGFIGYKGHSYLYDAYWDYFYKEKQFLKIWKEIYIKYILSSS